MSIHERTRQLAAAAIDFSLEPLERREFADHLSTCEACRAYDGAIRGDVAALRAIARQPAPSSVRQAVAGAVAARARDSLVPVRGRVWSPVSGPFANLARAAALLALLAALLLGMALSGLLTGGRPFAIDQTPSLPSASPGPSSIAKIAARPLVAVKATIPVCPGAVGLQADAGALWFSCSGTIWRADVASGTARAIIGGASLAVGPAGLWVIEGTAVLRLDPATGAVLARISHVGGAALAVGSGAVWVADMGAGTVTRIDPARNRVSATIRVGADPVGIVVGASAVWVADQGRSAGALNSTDRVSRIDPATDTVAAAIALDHGPAPILFIAGAVWVANDADGTVSMINSVTNHATSIAVDPSVLAEVLPAAGVLDDGALYVIDAHTAELDYVGTGPTGGNEPSVDPTTAQVIQRLVVPGMVPGWTAQGVPSMTVIDRRLWISNAAGTLLEVVP